MPAQIDFPFRFDRRGQVVVVEQDTPEELAAGVAVVLVTSPGDRWERPDFGAGDPAFRKPADVRQVIIDAARHVERADVDIVQEEFIDMVEQRIRVEVE